jgi:hypothetical protein
MMTKKYTHINICDFMNIKKVHEEHSIKESSWKKIKIPLDVEPDIKNNPTK